MASLLDSSALSGIAVQLLAARRRLSLRTGGELPTVGQIALGLREYIAHCDEERLAERDRASENDVVEVPDAAFFVTREEKLELRHLVSLCELTYKPRATLMERSATVPVFRILSARHEAERWSPAYFLAYFPSKRTLLLAVRGSHETSDFLTNLSIETDQFLDGVGHRGVIRSARNLHTQLLPSLQAHIVEHEVDRLVLTGHSLGGAVASAITLILRNDTQGHQLFQDATCVAMSPPPFLSRRLAAKTAQMGVTTVVTGLDAVPRLSAPSLDRFLLKLARFDWGSRLQASAGRTVSAYVPGNAAESVERFITDRGATTAAWTISALNTAAQGTLDARRRSNQPGSWFDGVLTAGVMATSLIENQFFVGSNSTHQRGRRGSNGRSHSNSDAEYPFAAHFGMSGEEVERVLENDGGPPDMFLAGDVFYLEIPFLSAAEFNNNTPVRRGRIRKVARDDLTQVEASCWMLAHHKPSILIDQLDLMVQEDGAAEESESQQTEPNAGGGEADDGNEPEEENTG